MPKNRNPKVDYSSRDFQSIREDLENFAKRYYPDTYKDFNDASFGALMIDTVSYIGDQLSFYLDSQAQEAFIDTATSTQNIHMHARNMGFKGSRSPTSSGFCDFYIIVPSKIVGTGPDIRYAPVLEQGTNLTLAGNPFILTSNVDFSNSSNEVVVARVNSATGAPTSYAIKATGAIISGQYRTKSFSIGQYVKFRRVYFSAPDLAEVVSVTDSDGNTYYQVESLDQNTVYGKLPVDSTATTEGVKSILRPFVVKRRFCLRQDPDMRWYLQFGNGRSSDGQSVSVVEPGAVAIQSYGKNYISDTGFAPEKLLSTDSLGVQPINTQITIRYRTSGNRGNISTSAEGKVTNPKIVFNNSDSLDTSKKASVRASIECTNSEIIVAPDQSYDSTDIREAAKGVFSRQKRAVTLNDYRSLIYSMENVYGAIKRCNVVQDKDSFKRNINIYVISDSSNGGLIRSSDVLKQNLKTWISEHKMMNDTVDILDAKVVNFKIDFGVKTEAEADHNAVMQRAKAVIKSITAVKKMEIGQDFPLGELYKKLSSVSGVNNVTHVTISTATGGAYSDMRFNVEENTSADARFIKAPLNVIFEVKYPQDDIKGVIV